MYSNGSVCTQKETEHNSGSKVRFSGEASKLQYLPFKLAILDTTKIRELGWKPMTDIEKMFKWTLESFL